MEHNTHQIVLILEEWYFEFDVINISLQSLDVGNKKL